MYSDKKSFRNRCGFTGTHEAGSKVVPNINMKGSDTEKKLAGKDRKRVHWNARYFASFENFLFQDSHYLRAKPPFNFQRIGHVFSA